MQKLLGRATPWSAAEVLKCRPAGAPRYYRDPHPAQCELGIHSNFIFFALL